MTPMPTTAQPSPGCGQALPGRPQPGASANREVQLTDPLMGPVTRHYRLHLPQNFDTSNTSPLPQLLNYHGWGGGPKEQERYFAEVSDADPQGFLLVSGKGMGDMSGQDYKPTWGSWNTSRTNGPLGDTCDRDRASWWKIPCYDSCSSCSSSSSCDWTTCYDDVAYTEALIDEIGSLYCIDLASIHLTGFSNGGMFAHYIASRTTRLATIGPVGASPLLGFGDPPSLPMSLIDFHATDDTNVPYDMAGAEAMGGGAGPLGSLINEEGFFYEDKVGAVGLVW